MEYIANLCRKILENLKTVALYVVKCNVLELPGCLAGDSQLMASE